MKSLNELLEEIIQARLQDDFGQTKALYEQVLEYYLSELTPTVGAEIHNNLGVIHYKQNDFAAALKHYAQAVQLQPDYLEAHLNLGLLFLRRNEQDPAIRQFCNALALYPESVMANWQLANLYLARSRVDDAIKHYRMVLELQPQHIETLNNLGVALLQQNKLDAAIEYFSRVLLIDHQHRDARSNLATVLLQQDRFKDAIWHYQLFLKLAPEDVDAQYNLGVAYMAAGHLEDAIQQFENVLKLSPAHVDAHCNLGAIYLRLEDITRAIGNYRRALMLRPNDKAIQFRLLTLTGDRAVPAAAPVEYVKNLFDNYAGYFDRQVTEELHYKLPMAIRKILLACRGDRLVARALDLGCGTGLAGDAIKDLADRWVGVDISPRMLTKAREKNIYQELIESDITQFLTTTTEHFDLIIAADTLVYFGDLDNIFSACYRVLNQEGVFVFSTEHGTKESYQLLSTGRYTHAKSYIEALAKQHGFTLLASEPIISRLQQGKSVLSDVFVLTIDDQQDFV
jgi:predicted TPR repeat methyltransferase